MTSESIPDANPIQPAPNHPRPDPEIAAAWRALLKLLAFEVAELLEAENAEDPKPDMKPQKK